MIADRFIKIINARLPKKGAFTQLEKETGISARTWGHAYNKRIQLTAEHVEHMCRIFPEYTFWLMTGKAAPEAGQTSPDIEQLEELKKAVNE